MEKTIKLSDKQKEVIDFIRRGAPLHYYGDSNKYRQANDNHNHCIRRRETITPLIEMGIFTKRICYANIWLMELTELGKTINID